MKKLMVGFMALAFCVFAGTSNGQLPQNGSWHFSQQSQIKDATPIIQDWWGQIVPNGQTGLYDASSVAYCKGTPFQNYEVRWYIDADGNGEEATLLTTCNVGMSQANPVAGYGHTQDINVPGLAVPLYGWSVLLEMRTYSGALLHSSGFIWVNK